MSRRKGQIINGPPQSSTTPAMQNNETIYILTFHGIGNPERQLPLGEDEYWLESSFFESILDMVKGRRDVRITFDDSNSSDYHIAYRALAKRGLAATFFLVSKRINEFGYLTQGQIQELAASGMTIGSHGTLHRPWATLNAAELDLELKESKSVLEGVVSTNVFEAACPLGSYNRRVLQGLRKNGYLRVFTSDGGPSKSNEWIAPRNTIIRSHTLGEVEELLATEPHGTRAATRSLRLLLKRWR